MVATENKAEAKPYAIVEHGGRQFRVEPGDILTVDRIDSELGSKIELGRTLMLNDGARTTVGKPVVAGAKVTATILAHERAKKILVFKFKKVKNYRRKRGHRQDVTRIKIEQITL